MVQFRHPRLSDCECRQFAERRNDMLLDDQAVHGRRLRLAARRHVLVQIAGREIGHRRPVREPQSQRLGHRLLAGLDPRDDQRRAPTRLLGRNHPVTAHRHPFRRCAAGARLHDIVFAPRRIHPHPEADELAVPEHRVLLDPQRLDGAP